MSPDPAKKHQPATPLSVESLGEDWEEDMIKSALPPPADPKLAGLYKVTHGELFFSKDKIVKTGRKVRLTAEQAQHFLSLELVEKIAA